MSAPQGEDRRRFGRVQLHPPLPARLGDASVEIADVAMGGARVMSVARFAPGTTVELLFEWEGVEVRAMCRIIRCTVAQFAKAPGEKSIYQTGLQMVEVAGESDYLIRRMIATQVMRALDEQRANAFAMPSVARLIEPHEVTRFRRCELNDGRWRRMETTSADQPSNGFTVDAAMPLKLVTMLCETFQRADEEGRRLMRVLAQLSVTKGEGSSIRRYIP